jgi:uncharacterized protein YbjQ (UPF0145 family)
VQTNRSPQERNDKIAKCGGNSVVAMDFSVKTTGHVRRHRAILAQPKEALP